MNTAEALESITDRGKFELLVNSILRKSKKEYSALISTGINAAGETIKSPVDGFCEVPGSDPKQFVIVEHTTTDRKKLEEKWLFENKSTSKKKTRKRSDGDLIKAGKEAKELRIKFPDAKFVVILTTNQRISAELSKKVYKKASDLKVTAEIVDQSILADFLDSKSEGQWLKKEHLGIEAEMMSKPLLKSLCQQSLNLYKKSLFIDDQSFLVTREIVKNIEKDIHTISCPIHFISGESGFGKSIASYSVLKNHIDSGGYGMWLPAEYLKVSISIENSMEKLLSALHPNLLKNSWRNVLNLITPASQFLIVIDDINKTENPTQLLDKLLSWAKPQSSNSKNTTQSSPPYVILCPVWPQIWKIIDRNGERNWVKPFFIGPMTPEEGSLVIKSLASNSSMDLTTAESHELSNRMGNDPFLIGLFGQLIASVGQNEPKLSAENIIEKFITNLLNTMDVTHSTSFLAIEYETALYALSSNMIKNRNWHPKWGEIKNWLKGTPQKIDAIRQLTKNGKLCKLTEDGHFDFRHDRIRNHLLSVSVADILKQPESYDIVLNEPYFSGIVGKSIAQYPQAKKILEKIKVHLPLALFEAIRHFGTPASDYHHLIIELAKKWLKHNLETGHALEAIIDEISWILLETDSPAVIEITDILPKNNITLLARLRNGCAKSGAVCLYKMNETVAAHLEDSLLERIISHTKIKHGRQILQELKILLNASNITDDLRRGVLSLAGFLGYPEFQTEILKCWKRSIDRTKILGEAIWAASQCCRKKPESLLDPLMRYWNKLPGGEDYTLDSEKNWIANLLKFAFKKGINNIIIGYFIDYAKNHKSMERVITIMLIGYDSPNAVEYIVRRFGERSSTPLIVHPKSFWSDYKKLSQASLHRLKLLWENPNNDKFLRLNAFQIWLTKVEKKHIDILKAITPNSPLYKMAIPSRVQLGDMDSVNDLIALMEKKGGLYHFYLMIAHNVWGSQMKIFIEEKLKSLGTEIPKDFSGRPFDLFFNLSRFLMKVPPEDAEELLGKYWNHLCYSSNFIQTALYIGTSKSLELADRSIKKCPKNIDLFEYISNQYGVLEVGMHEYLNIKHLENLKPYLTLINKRELSNLAELCQRMGIPEWSKQNISSLLEKKGLKRYHPTNENLVEDLDRFVNIRQGKFSVKYWIEDSEKRHEPKSRILKVTEKWLAQNPTIDRLEIASACIQEIGCRKDLEILDKYIYKGTAAEIEKIKENTRLLVFKRTLY